MFALFAATAFYQVSLLSLCVPQQCPPSIALSTLSISSSFFLLILRFWKLLGCRVTATHLALLSSWTTRISTSQPWAPRYHLQPYGPQSPVRAQPHLLILSGLLTAILLQFYLPFIIHQRRTLHRRYPFSISLNASRRQNVKAGGVLALTMGSLFPITCIACQS